MTRGGGSRAPGDPDSTVTQASPNRSSMTQRRALILAIAVLMAWALGLRVWYASADLRPDRFWDERYSVPNVHAALEEGTLKPKRYAYLRLTYLPQVAVLGGIQAAARIVQPAFSWFEDTEMRPGGYLACRLIAVAIGCLTILLTIRLGTRLISPEVGLLAGFLVAASPTHLVYSSIFKPDIVVVATTLLAVLWSLRAVSAASVGAYLLAGVGIGLALSSKPTGGATAVPLALAAGWLGWRNRRHWLGLVSAALVSASIFLALNPFPRYLSAFRLQRNRYDSVALRKGTLGDPVATARHVFRTLFEGAHGPIVGTLAAAGVVVLLVLVWRRRGTSGGRDLAMALTFPVVFSVLYGLVTQNVLPNNFLPVLPYTALAAAFVLAAVGRGLANLVAVELSAVVKWPAVAALLLVAAQPAQLRAYRVLVPTTAERATAKVEQSLAEHELPWLGVEPDPRMPAVGRDPGPPHRPLPGTHLWTHERLSDEGSRQLDAADALIFPAARLEPGTTLQAYRRLMRRGTRFDVHPKWFRARGPSQVVVLHPWRLTSREKRTLAPSAGPGRYATSLRSAPGERRVAALRFVAAGDETSSRPSVRARRGLNLLARTTRGKTVWTTDRFLLEPGGETAIRINLPWEAIRRPDGTLEVTSFQWTPATPDSATDRD